VLGALADGYLDMISRTYSETCYEHVDLIAAIFGFEGV